MKQSRFLMKLKGLKEWQNYLTKGKSFLKRRWPLLYGLMLLILLLVVIYQQSVISTLEWQINYQNTYHHKDSYAHRLFHLEVIQRALNSDVYHMKKTIKDLSEDNMYLKMKVNDLEWKLMKSQWVSPKH